MFDLEVCEHEAAHAVLARHFGVKVLEIRVDVPSADVAGRCEYDPAGWFEPGAFSGRLVECLATSVAPEIWLTEIERKRFPRAGGFGSDRAGVDQVLRDATPEGASDLRSDLRRRAKALAREVLDERRDDVLAVAGRLAMYGRFDAREGWARAAAPAPAVRRLAPARRPVTAVRSAPVTSAKEELRAELVRLVDSGLLDNSEAHRRWERAGHRAIVAVRSA